jgi:hypothetical protein
LLACLLASFLPSFVRWLLECLLLWWSPFPLVACSCLGYVHVWIFPCLTYPLVGCLAGCLLVSLLGRLVGCLLRWMMGVSLAHFGPSFFFFFGWLVGWVLGCLVNSLVRLLIS